MKLLLKENKKDSIKFIQNQTAKMMKNETIQKKMNSSINSNSNNCQLINSVNNNNTNKRKINIKKRSNIENVYDNLNKINKDKDKDIDVITNNDNDKNIYIDNTKTNNKKYRGYSENKEYKKSILINNEVYINHISDYKNMNKNQNTTVIPNIKPNLTSTESSSNQINQRLSLNIKSFLQKFDERKENKVKSNEEQFEYDKEKEVELTSEEKLIYNNRDPPIQYRKLKLIGKGGCGIVYLSQSLVNGMEYALKQISKKSKSDVIINSNRREIEILTYFNKSETETETKTEYKVFYKHIIKLIEYIEDNNDIWIVFEKGGRSIGTLMFKIKGDFIENERIYLIKKGRFYEHLFENEINFKNFFKKLLEIILYITNHNYIHCDIKPDNLLYNYDSTSNINDIMDFSSLKIIDFGSAFHSSHPENFSSNTPEYIPPEITEALEKKGAKEIFKFLSYLDKYPHAIDVWSVGIMILEIILCCPVWMSYKCKTNINGRVSIII